MRFHSLLSCLLLKQLVLFSCWSNVLCNTIHIISNPESDCPVPGQCQTLQQYADQPVGGSDIVLEIQPGNHSLATELSLTSAITNLNITSSNGESEIVCQRNGVIRGFFTINGIQNVHIKGVTIINCYLNDIMNVDSFILEDSVIQGGSSTCWRFESTNTAVIRRSSLSHCAGTMISIEIGADIVDLSVYDSEFSFNGDLQSNEGGAIRTSFSPVSVYDSNFYGNTGQSFGGAIYVLSGLLTVSKCNFTSNSAGISGGALLLVQGTISDSYFIENTGARRGGAITIENINSEVAIISGCGFVRNNADVSGGAVEMQGGMISSCNFIENSASGDEGRGGAINYGESLPRTLLEIHDSTFIDNMAGSYSGAVNIFHVREDINITNSDFINNMATFGGAIRVFKNTDEVTLYITNCKFENNRAEVKPPQEDSNIRYRGGAIYIVGGITCYGSSFINNVAFLSGGAVYMSDRENIFQAEKCVFINNTAITGEGGVLYGTRDETSMLIMESTFINNTARICGVAYMFLVSTSYHNNLTIVSSVFENNKATDNSTDRGGGVACVSGGTLSVTCSAFDENTAANHGGVFYASVTTVSISACSFNGNYAGDNGGVLYAATSSHSVLESIFNNNSASGNGGSMYILASNGGSHEVTNSVFANNIAFNRGGAYYVASTSLTASGTNFINNMDSLLTLCTGIVVIGGGENLEVITDPMRSSCTLYNGDITQFEMSNSLMCPALPTLPPTTTSMPPIETTDANTTPDLMSSTTRRPNDSDTPMISMTTTEQSGSSGASIRSQKLFVLLSLASCVVMLKVMLIDG